MRGLIVLVGFAILGFVAAGIGLKYAYAAPCNSGCSALYNPSCVGASFNGCYTWGCEDDRSSPGACGGGTEYSGATPHDPGSGSVNIKVTQVDCTKLYTCVGAPLPNNECQIGLSCHFMYFTKCRYCANNSGSWAKLDDCTSLGCCEE